MGFLLVFYSNLVTTNHSPKMLCKCNCCQENNKFSLFCYNKYLRCINRVVHSLHSWLTCEAQGPNVLFSYSISSILSNNSCTFMDSRRSNSCKKTHNFQYRLHLLKAQQSALHQWNYDITIISTITLTAKKTTATVQFFLNRASFLSYSCMCWHHNMIWG